MSSIIKRVGMFAVHTSLIENQPEIALLIFKDIIVMQAMPVGNVIRYTGISKHFRKLTFDATVPEYTCEAMKDDADNMFIEWSEATKIVAGVG